MNIPTIPQRWMREYVNAKKAFKGSNVFTCIATEWEITYDDLRVAQNTEVKYVKRYIVYSYGVHFPMYIYVHDLDQWFGNEAKYSPSTSRHQSACRPRDILDKPIRWLSTRQMEVLAVYGFPNFMQTQTSDTPV